MGQFVMIVTTVKTMSEDSIPLPRNVLNNEDDTAQALLDYLTEIGEVGNDEILKELDIEMRAGENAMVTHIGTEKWDTDD